MKFRLAEFVIPIRYNTSAVTSARSQTGQGREMNVILRLQGGLHIVSASRSHLLLENLRLLFCDVLFNVTVRLDPTNLDILEPSRESL